MITSKSSIEESRGRQRSHVKLNTEQLFFFVSTMPAGVAVPEVLCWTCQWVLSFTTSATSPEADKLSSPIR